MAKLVLKQSVKAHGPLVYSGQQSIELGIKLVWHYISGNVSVVFYMSHSCLPLGRVVYFDPSKQNARQQNLLGQVLSWSS